MDPDLGMEGVCVPWQNKHDIEPLLINTECEYIQEKEIPGIRIYRSEGRRDPFDIYFCRTKYNAYRVIMGLDRQEIEERMTQRSKRDLESISSWKIPSSEQRESLIPLYQFSDTLPRSF